MKVAVACDHGGFPLKEEVLQAVQEAGHEAIDLGTFSPERVDYPVYAEKIARAILEGEAERGVLLCGSGVGACIAANKFPGVFAAVCHDAYSAHQGVEHDAMNVLCLGARVIGPALACELVRNFLRAEYLNRGRYAERVAMVQQIESEHLGSSGSQPRRQDG
jgi:ribose 5-phosphate isomerase B